MSYSPDQILLLYNQHVLPKLTTKNKWIGITAAITLSTAYFIKKILTPPKNLRHIRYHISPLSLVRSIWKGETYWQRAHRVYLPIVDDPENHNALYLVTNHVYSFFPIDFLIPSFLKEYDRAGWEIYLCNPQMAKEMLLNQGNLNKNK